MAHWFHDLLDPLPFFRHTLHSIQSQVVADNAVPRRPRVLDLALLAAPSLPQFRDHQNAAGVWTFSHDPNPPRPKHLVGDFYDGDGVRVTRKRPSASRTRRHLVGGGRHEHGVRDDFGF